MLQPPRSLKTDRLVNTNLICHAYFFVGMLESTAAFLNYFWFMTSQGFRVSDLIFAWDWGEEGFGGFTADEQVRVLCVDSTSCSRLRLCTVEYCAVGASAATGTSQSDLDYVDHCDMEQNAILATGQSVYFITLVLCQLGNLLSTRRRRLPYGYTIPHALMPQPIVATPVRVPMEVRLDHGSTPPNRARLEVSSRSVAGPGATDSDNSGRNQLPSWLPGAVRFMACCLASIVIAIIVTEIPAVQTGIQTASVSGKFWGSSVLAAAAIFGLSEARKWWIIAYPTGLLARWAW